MHDSESSGPSPFGAQSDSSAQQVEPAAISVVLTTTPRHSQKNLGPHSSDNTATNTRSVLDPNLAVAFGLIFVQHT